MKIRKEELQSIILDLDNWEKNGLDPKKGLILLGNTGVGKTTCMKKLIKLRHKPGGHNYTQREINGYGNFRTFQNGRSLDKYQCFVDDIGGKSATVTHYGTETKPIADLIDYRYEILQRDAVWCENTRFNYFISNYFMEDLETDLLKNIEDRLHDMCNIVIVIGESYRK